MGGRASGLHTAETSPPRAPSGVPPPEISGPLPLTRILQTCRPPPDLQTCARGPGTHMPIRGHAKLLPDDLRSTKHVPLLHKLCAQKHMNAHPCPAVTFMPTHRHLHLPHTSMSMCTHPHGHTHMLTWTHGCAGHLLRHTSLQRRLMGTPTVVRGDVFAHRLAISRPCCVPDC